MEATRSFSEPSAGDAIPGECEVIRVHVGELKQLFHSLDPSPFRDRDLDPNAEAFIVRWARNVSRRTRLALLVQIDRPAGLAEEPALLRDSVHEFFGYRATTARQRLSELFHVGRVSLAIGVFFLTVSVLLGGTIEMALANSRGGALLRESLLIGGWVAMWRPLEIFLYDWWPIRGEIRLFDRLATMPVRIAYGDEAGTESWRQDWPAVPANRAVPG
jgi:hypothetical protein